MVRETYIGDYLVFTRYSRTVPCYVTEVVPVRGRDVLWAFSLVGMRLTTRHYTQALINHGMQVARVAEGNVVEDVREVEKMHDAMTRLCSAKKLICTKQYNSLKGQIMNGDIDRAMEAMERAVEKRRKQKEGKTA